ncbi:MAG TPA: MerR family transcriptional regulator [Desulfosporosinus sp.]|nr:MerR family transcriptional regulator [Desulfosporosinus sp.]
MLKIGVFSLLTSISIRMLRYYNDIGLLIPTHIDDETSYRFYDESQLTVANKIQALKGMGLGITSIKEVLEVYDSAPNIIKYLNIQVMQKQEELLNIQNYLSLLQTTIKRLKKTDDVLQCSIAVKEISECNVASMRDIIFARMQEGELWIALDRDITALKVQKAKPTVYYGIFHDEGYVENNLDLEVQITVIGDYPDTERIKFKTIPPTLAATITYQGAYELLPEMRETLAGWAKDNQYEFSGEIFNIYHVYPTVEYNTENFITEVCLPIIKK